MPQSPRPAIIRKAVPGDEARISGLYQEIYRGTYPDPLMTKVSVLAEALRKDEYLWVVADTGDAIVGSVVYRIDNENLLAKVFGAVVLPEFRGSNLTQRLMTFGVEQMSAEIIYATTRTVTPVPQKLTASLGYKKLGIFPNVHKTEDYETHALTALVLPAALARRHADFELHARIAPLFDLVQAECQLPDLPILADPPNVSPANRAEAPQFEMISATRFVQHHFRQEKAEVARHRWFFPFQEPNILLTTPDQSVEVYAFLSETDKHCVIMGIRRPEHGGPGFETILDAACRFLRDQAARYLEFIVRADEAATIEAALACDFIPCAYFPALMLQGERRYDFVVFSRSFEILDFKNIKLEGLNRQYLELYYDHWRGVALSESLENRR